MFAMIIWEDKYPDMRKELLWKVFSRMSFFLYEYDLIIKILLPHKSPCKSFYCLTWSNVCGGDDSDTYKRFERDR